MDLELTAVTDDDDLLRSLISQLQMFIQKNFVCTCGRKQARRGTAHHLCRLQF